MRQVKVFAASVLTCVGVMGLIGCILIPGNYQPEDGKRPEAQIGTRKENRPLRVLESSREDADRVLGKPWRASADGRTAVYQYEVNTMTFVTLCYGVSPNFESRYLIVRFTEDGRLSEYRVTKSQPEAFDAAGR